MKDIFKDVREKHAGELPAFLTVEEAAKILNMSPKGVQRLCREKILGNSKPGKSFLIPPESLEEYLSIIR